MESMSNAPYLVLKARSGLRLGHGEIVDHMFFDGLEDAYDQGKLRPPGGPAPTPIHAYSYPRHCSLPDLSGVLPSNQRKTVRAGCSISSYGFTREMQDASATLP